MVSSHGWDNRQGSELRLNPPPQSPSAPWPPSAHCQCLPAPPFCPGRWPQSVLGHCGVCTRRGSTRKGRFLVQWGQLPTHSCRPPVPLGLQPIYQTLQLSFHHCASIQLLHAHACSLLSPPRRRRKKRLSSPAMTKAQISSCIRKQSSESQIWEDVKLRTILGTHDLVIQCHVEARTSC